MNVLGVNLLKMILIMIKVIFSQIKVSWARDSQGHLVNFLDNFITQAMGNPKTKLSF